MAIIYTSCRFHFCLFLPTPQRTTFYYLHHSLVEHSGCYQPYQIVSIIMIQCPVLVTCVCHRWHNWRKFPITIPMTVMAGLLLSCGFTACHLHISRYNYPGGHAFSKLHTLINSSLDSSMSETCKGSTLTSSVNVLRYIHRQYHCTYQCGRCSNWSVTLWGTATSLEVQL